MSMAADDVIPRKEYPGLRPLFILSAIGIAFVERLSQPVYVKGPRPEHAH